METTPEQVIGHLAAQAIDNIDGRPVVAAVMIVVVDMPEPDEDGDRVTESRWYVPADQLRYTTIGLLQRSVHDLVTNQ